MKLRLSSRMRAGFAVMSLLMLVAGLVTVFYTYRIHDATANLLARSVRSLKTAETIELAADRVQASTTDELLKGGGAQHALEVRKAEFKKLLDVAEQAATAPQQAEVLGILATRLAEYEWNVSRALVLAQAGQSEAARAQIARAKGMAADLYDRCEGLEALNEALMYADLGSIDESNRAVRLAMYGLGAAGILLGWGLALAISRSIRNPICELVLKVRDATGHAVVERVDVPRGAELEVLDEHVRQLIDRINTTSADLEKSRKLLERSEKLAALGRVSAGIAHEIRNPLTSIKMLIYGLREEDGLAEEQKKDLAVILQEIDRMDRFVDNFLKFARPPDPKLVVVDPNQIVRETLDLLAPRLRQAGTQLIERYQPDLGTIAADPDQIRQVIMNLVLNALDAMPDGGSLLLETRRQPASEDEPSWVQLRVKDTGHGIPVEILESLFDPFVSGRDEGAGLGLAISHQIIQQHGGWIDAQGDPQGGTAIIVRLPDRRGHDHAQSVGSGRRGERPLLVPKNAA